jgi:hypothetical protein
MCKKKQDNENQLSKEIVQTNSELNKTLVEQEESSNNWRFQEKILY